MSNKARIIQTHAFEKFNLDKPTGNPMVSESQAWSSELCDLLGMCLNQVRIYGS